MQKFVHECSSMFVCNSQKLNPNQMSINRGTDKQIVVFHTTEYYATIKRKYSYACQITFKIIILS